MEDILSSIKRIIAEDSDGASDSASGSSSQLDRRSRFASESARPISLSNTSDDAQAKPATSAQNIDSHLADDSDDDEIFELTDSLDELPSHAESASTLTPQDVGFDEVDEFEKPVTPIRASQPAPIAAKAQTRTEREIAPEAASEPEAVPVQRKAFRPVAPVQANILSEATELATKSSLAALASALQAPEPVTNPSASVGGTSLEDLVGDLLRPMLKQWLDTNLPNMVESLVVKEITRITGRSV